MFPPLLRCALLLVLATQLYGAQPTSGPNILLILADDMGFADAGCYGSEIHTPNLDRLAANGIRFTQFYNTARCWPTRSALLTGYYPQQIRMDPPFGRLPLWTRLLPQYLKPLGYHSYHSGKWHVNGAPKSLADGGFDRSYRLEDHDRNFYPTNLWLDDVRLPPVPKGSNYYTTVAFADFMIACLKEHAEKYPTQPFFGYLAFTVPHFPLQAPQADIARYRDTYQAGWDVIRQQRYDRQLHLGLVNCALSEREPGEVPYWNLKESELLQQVGSGEVARAIAWMDLTGEQRRFQATKMAIHAAMIDRMDQEIGRVLAQLKVMGAYENTLVMFASDNGTSAEFLNRGDKHDKAAGPGSGGSFLCLGPGWSTVGNTPFRLHKSWVHEGGISTPLILHWPAGIAAHGEWRHTVGHVIDIVPTILELVGARPEPQWHGMEAPLLPGRSLVPAFATDANVPRDYLYFHHENNRALRIGDWKLVSKRPNTNDYELYDLSRDRSEQTNLAAAEPERVQAMAKRWDEVDTEFALTRRADPRPNVLFVLCDDLGINDLHCYGRQDHRTPNLDKLATQGLRFTSAYCAQPICSPSRAAILTGKTPARLHLTTYLPGRPDCVSQKVLHPEIQMQVPLSEKMMSRYFKEVGYATAAIGKWHVGGKGFGPIEHGFDFYHPGQPNTEPSATEGGKGEYDLTAAAERFMESNRDRPFLIYLAHNTPHIPYAAQKERVGHNTGAFEPVYAAVIETLDDTVGRLLAKLDALKLANKTIVVFTSDNGGLHVPEGTHSKITHNSPYRAGKGFVYEGGLRIPLIVRWPGHVPAGAVSSEPVINTGWLPTLLDLVGEPVPPGLDGVSFAAHLTGRGPAPKQPLFWQFPHYTNQGSRPSGAMRDGDWMLVEYYDEERVELYSLPQDIGETQNLADRNPERVVQMRAALAAWRQQISAQSNRPNPDFDPVKFRELYQDVDASLFSPAQADVPGWERMWRWRKEMDAVLPHR
jgi:arylsulfatase